MKKRFIDLKHGDTVWYCSPDYYLKQEPLKIVSIEATSKALKIGLSGDYHCLMFSDKERVDENRSIVRQFDTRSSYRNQYYYFCNESDWQRYRKAQGIKHLQTLIAAAKKAVDSVKEFRVKNFADLNKNWLESEIIKLEKETA